MAVYYQILLGVIVQKYNSTEEEENRMNINLPVYVLDFQFEV